MHLFQENRGPKTIFGNMEHRKTNFQFLVNRGTSHNEFREQVTLSERASILGSKYTFLKSKPILTLFLRVMSAGRHANNLLKCITVCHH